LSQTAKVLQNFRERCRKLRKCSKISGSAVVSGDALPTVAKAAKTARLSKLFAEKPPNNLHFGYHGNPLG